MKYLQGIALIFIFIGLSIETEASICEGVYEVNFSIINVRNGPGLGYEKIAELHKFDRVSVTSCPNYEWMQISAPHIPKGFIHKKYLHFISQDNLRAEMKEKVIAEIEHSLYTMSVAFKLTPKKLYIVDAPWVRVRNGPGTEFTETGELRHGDIIEIIDIKNGNWAFFKKNGLDMYTSLDYLSPVNLSAGEQSLPYFFMTILSEFLPYKLDYSFNNFSLISITESTPLPIFMYHYIGDIPSSQKNNESRRALTVSAEKFEKHLQYLKANNFTTFTFDQLAKKMKDKSQIPIKTVMITFDDGYKSQYAIAYPLLKKYGFTATFFIITDKISKAGFMDMEDIKTIASHDFQIASHTHTHPVLTSLSDEQIRFELQKSKDILERSIQKKVNTLCYPSGEYDERVMRIAKKIGYTFGRTTKNSSFVNISKPFELPGKRMTEYTSLAEMSF